MRSLRSDVCKSTGHVHLDAADLSGVSVDYKKAQIPVVWPGMKFLRVDASSKYRSLPAALHALTDPNLNGRRCYIVAVLINHFQATIGSKSAAQGVRRSGVFTPDKYGQMSPRLGFVPVLLSRHLAILAVKLAP
jgi:hypothetical protein